MAFGGTFSYCVVFALIWCRPNVYVNHWTSIHWFRVCHNDLRGDNVLVGGNDGSPDVVIIDFGLSTSIGDESGYVYGMDLGQ